RAIEHKLTLPVNMNFKDTTLSDAIQALRQQSGVNIVVDLAALKEASISLQQPITLPAENISLKSALRLLNKQTHLAYVIGEEVLQITTPEHASGGAKVVTYPIADLVVPVDNHPTQSVFSFPDAIERHIISQAGGTMATQPYPGPLSLPNGQPVSSQGTGLPGHYQAPNGLSPRTVSAAPQRRPGQPTEDLLINLIQNTVAPNSWKDVGGQGTIQYYPLGMALVVNQTQE